MPTATSAYSLPEPTTEEIDLPTVLAALADPVRLATVRTIAAAGEMTCGHVGTEAGLNIGKSTLSHHLRVLREAGITRTRVVGARRYISLRRQDLDSRFPDLLGTVLKATETSTVPAPAPQPA